MPTCRAGTYEREIGKDGFFGPADAHSITGIRRPAGVDFEGPLRPRAFDRDKLAADAADDPWQAGAAADQRRICRSRIWQLRRRR